MHAVVQDYLILIVTLPHRRHRIHYCYYYMDRSLDALHLHTATILVLLHPFSPSASLSLSLFSSHHQIIIIITYTVIFFIILPRLAASFGRVVDDEKGGGSFISLADYEHKEGVKGGG